MSTPGYLSNAELAAKVSSVVDRWNTRENQMIAFISQPNGTVVVTDGVGNHHELPSFPQLQLNVAALVDDLTGAVAQAQDINAVSVSLLNQTNAGVATIDASLASANTAATAAEASASTASTKASEAQTFRNQANTHKNAAASSATTANTHVTTATSKADAAASSADAAAGSASAAATSATNAATSASTASTKATESQTFRNQSQTFRNQAQTHANAASTKDTEAAQSATEAEGFKSAAASSASQANSHKTAAAASASTATDQADIASGAMEIATDAADIAVTERSAAQAAAVTAQQHATRAGEWANHAPNVAVDNGEYSARHWAQQAQEAAAGAMTYKGTWSATSGQFPANPATGDLYVVSTAGTVNGLSFAVGDQAIYSSSAWEKIENVQSVTSVAGKTGAVVLAAGDIKSGTLNAARIPALPVSKVTGLQTALDGKAAGMHTHALADVQGLQAALDGKAPSVHNHAWSEVTGKPAQATRWPKWGEVTNKPTAFTPTNHGHAWGEITGTPASYPPSVHTHAIADVTGLQPALNNKFNLTGGTLTGNLKIEREGGAQIRLHCTAGNGREVLLHSTPAGNTGLWDVTNNKALLRVDGNDLITTKGFSGEASVYAYTTGNAHYWLRDETGQKRGLVYWNRANGALYLQGYDSETEAVKGRLRINAEGTVTSDGAITAPGFTGTATRADRFTSSTTINGTSFNGTADIITSRWGAERTLKIGNASKAVNGTGNVTWTLADIGAAPTGHSHAWSAVTGKPAQATRWPKWGEVAEKPEAFPAAAHEHPITAIVGLHNALEGRVKNASGVTHMRQITQAAYNALATKDPNTLYIIT